MINIFAMVCTFIFIGAALNSFSSLIKSDFLSKFLDQNLILLLVAGLAINAITINVILKKMREITDKNPKADFNRTMRAMKQATTEYICLIGSAVILQVIKGSTIVFEYLPYVLFIVDSLLIAIFAFLIQILYDTAKSLYVISEW